MDACSERHSNFGETFTIHLNTYCVTGNEAWLKGSTEINSIQLGLNVLDNFYKVPV